MRIAESLTSFLVVRRIHWMEIAVLTALLLGVYSINLQGISFHTDESDWIWTSQGLEALVRGQFGSKVWNGYQPPVTGYFIAISRRLGGYGVRALNDRWNGSLTFAGNVAAGNMPFPGLLWWSRLGMIVLSAAGVAIGAFLVARAYARGAVYLFFLLFIWDPTYNIIFRRAMNEAPLLFLSFLGGLLGTMGLAAFMHKQARRALVCFALFGVVGGLVGETKTNGLGVTVAGLAAILAVILLDSLWRSNGWHLRWAATLGVVCVAATAFSFLISNPYVYPSPVQRTILMIDKRTRILNDQISLPGVHITGSNWLQIVPQRIFAQFATFPYPGEFPVNVILLLIGLASSIRVIWRRRSGWEAQTILLSLAVFCAGPALLTPLDWARYYMYPVVFARVYVAMGFVVLLGSLIRGLAKRAGHPLVFEGGEASLPALDAK